jgi:hypothetical protein
VPEQRSLNSNSFPRSDLPTVWSVKLIDFGDANLDRRAPATADAVAEDLPGPQALGGGFLGAGAYALWTILMFEAWRRRWTTS